MPHGIPNNHQSHAEALSAADNSSGVLLHQKKFHNVPQHCIHPPEYTLHAITPYRQYGVYSDRQLNKVVYFNPFSQSWIDQDSGCKLHKQKVLCIEEYLDEDLDYGGIYNAQVVFVQTRWQ